MTSSFKLACIIPPEPIHSNFFKIRTNNTTTQVVSFTAKTLKLEKYRTKGLFYKQQTFYIPGIRVQVGERTEDFQQIIDFQSFENPNLVNSYVVTPITECIDIIQDSGHGGRHQLKNV